MQHINIEIKARCSDQAKVRAVLQGLGAEFKGLDHQVDTYFKVGKGRLKLREGEIENSLIYYERENQSGPKQSDVTLYRCEKDSSLKEVLAKSLGVLVVVDKKREIYFIDNIKFHIDEVKSLGQFVEIEAIDKDGTIGKEKLLEQCQEYMSLFNILDTDLVKVSYSDLLLER